MIPGNSGAKEEGEVSKNEVREKNGMCMKVQNEQKRKFGYDS